MQLRMSHRSAQDDSFDRALQFKGGCYTPICCNEQAECVQCGANVYCNNPYYVDVPTPLRPQQAGCPAYTCLPRETCGPGNLNCGSFCNCASNVPCTFVDYSGWRCAAPPSYAAPNNQWWAACGSNAVFMAGTFEPQAGSGTASGTMLCYPPYKYNRIDLGSPCMANDDAAMIWVPAGLTAQVFTNYDYDSPWNNGNQGLIVGPAGFYWTGWNNYLSSMKVCVSTNVNAWGCQ